MFKHKVDYTEHILNPVFLRAVALHFNDRKYKINTYISIILLRKTKCF